MTFCEVWEGDSSADPVRPVDLVFCHPYAPLPSYLHSKPKILNLYAADSMQKIRRLKQLEEWAGGRRLDMIASWGRGYKNTLYTSGLPYRPIKLDYLLEDEESPGVGFFPLELPLLLLGLYCDRITRGAIVWDGFCGRGTVGKACQLMGRSFIGIDKDPARVKMARAYLSLPEERA